MEAQVIDNKDCVDGVIPVHAEKMQIPPWEKYILSVDEASRYFHIGKNKIRTIISNNADAGFILWNCNRPMIKRKLFESFIDSQSFI